MRTSIQGVLKDAEGHPIPEAVVMIVDGTHAFTDIASVSDSNGIFHLSNIMLPGQYTLQVQSAKGMHTTEVTLDKSQQIEITWP